MNFAHVDVGTGVIIKRINQHPRADGGAVAGLIPGTAIVPVVYEDQPKHIDWRTHTATRAEPVVTKDAVVIGWDVTPLEPERVIQNIRQVAGEVITARYPLTKQQNLHAAVTASMADQRDGGEGDLAVEEAARVAWAWITAVRTESNVKEAALLAGEPFDLDAWPEAPQ